MTPRYFKSKLSRQKLMTGQNVKCPVKCCQTEKMPGHHTTSFSSEAVLKHGMMCKAEIVSLGVITHQ